MTEKNVMQRHFLMEHVGRNMLKKFLVVNKEKQFFLNLKNVVGDYILKVQV